MLPLFKRIIAFFMSILAFLGFGKPSKPAEPETTTEPTTIEEVVTTEPTTNEGEEIIITEPTTAEGETDAEETTTTGGIPADFVADTVVISFENHGNWGQFWVINKNGDSVELTADEDVYPAYEYHGSDIVGSASKRFLTYTAVRPGTTVINMAEYNYSSDDPVDTAQAVITVADDGTITVTQITDNLTVGRTAEEERGTFTPDQLALSLTYKYRPGYYWDATVNGTCVKLVDIITSYDEMEDPDAQQQESYTDEEGNTYDPPVEMIVLSKQSFVFESVRQGEIIINFTFYNDAGEEVGMSFAELAVAKDGSLSVVYSNEVIYYEDGFIGLTEIETL